jgi:uncharacterized pyridoxamine 5'-phosphate oxidase family protein
MRALAVLLAAVALTGFGQEGAKTAGPQSAKSYVFSKASAAKNDPLLNDAAAFLEKNNVLFLATYDGQSPRVRPVRYTEILDNKLAVASSTKKELSLQIAQCPQVEVSAASADGSEFLRFKGKVVVCGDAEIKAQFLKDHPKFQKMYGDSFVLYLVEPERVGLFPLKGGQPKTQTYKK